MKSYVFPICLGLSVFGAGVIGVVNVEENDADEPHHEQTIIH